MAHPSLAVLARIEDAGINASAAPPAASPRREPAPGAVEHRNHTARAVYHRHAAADAKGYHDRTAHSENA